MYKNGQTNPEKFIPISCMGPKHALKDTDLIFQPIYMHRSMCMCRRPGNGGPQTCLLVAHSVARRAALYGPSSPANTHDPRERPSLARQTMQDLLRDGLTKPAREGQRDQGEGHLARFL